MPIGKYICKYIDGAGKECGRKCVRTDGCSKHSAKGKEIANAHKMKYYNKVHGIEKEIVVPVSELRKKGKEELVVDILDESPIPEKDDNIEDDEVKVLYKKFEAGMKRCTDLISYDDDEL